MKNKLSDIYEQILLNEAEKSALENPSNNEVGSVKGGQELFGSKPDTKKINPESNKDSKVEAAKTLDRKVTNPEKPEGEEDKNANVKKGNLKSSVPAKSSDETEGSKPKPKGLGEQVNMGAFETLFRKTLVIENEEDMAPEFEAGDHAPSEETLDDEVSETESSETEGDETAEEEESDLLTDLRDLQTRISDIITKLEQAVEHEGDEDSEDADYSEEDFDQEFGDEETPSVETEEEVKTESVKNKSGLLGSNNKVGGKLKAAKGGKANTGKFVTKAEIKVLGDKKKALQKGNTVKSSVKGDLFK